MVPDKFNMVDMEGIDILFSYGDTIPGLYQKLVESITQCRYQCLYHWYFDGILIPPTYVEMVVIGNKVWIGRGISIDEENTLEFIAFELNTVAGEIAHIMDALAMKPNKIVCYINPEQAAGTPSPENPLPISGHTGCEIVGVGENVYDGTFYDLATAIYSVNGAITTYTGKGFACATYYDCSGHIGEKIYLNHRPTGNTGGFAFYDSSKTFISGIGNGGVTTEDEWIVDIPDNSNIKYFRFTGNSDYIDKTVLAYVPPAAQKIDITFPDAAGTVYSGTLTVNEDGSGKLAITDGNIASYNGEELPSTWISSMDVYAEGTTPTNGAQVVYKLAEPIIYNLTELQVFTLLQGENSIWHDANGDISVSYWKNKI